MKKRRWKFDRVTVIGLILLFFGIGAWINSIAVGDSARIIWVCYLSLILIGIGALKKDSFLMASQVYILGIPLVVWDIDFFFRLISGKTLFGITDYFFAESFSFGKFLSLQHLFVVPLALYAIYLVGLKRNDAWKVSLVELIGVYFITLIFTPASENLNCVFSSCVNVSFGLPYAVTWFVLSFAMVFFAAILINRFLFKSSKVL